MAVRQTYVFELGLFDTFSIMRLFFSTALLGTLSLNLLLGELNAKPLSSALIELRIRKDVDLHVNASNDRPLLTVRDVILIDRNISHLPDYPPNSTTVAIMEHFFAMYRQKREASNFKEQEDLELRQPHKKRKACKKKKYKKCDGVYKMFWNTATKQCDLCPVGKEPDAKTDKCVDPETPEQEKERGKCPPGKKLDPNVPGQVSWNFILVYNSIFCYLNLLNSMQSGLLTSN